jgi:hypothetical protein
MYKGDLVMNGTYLWYVWYQDARGTKATENKGMLRVVR